VFLTPTIATVLESIMPRRFCVVSIAFLLAAVPTALHADSLQETMNQTLEAKQDQLVEVLRDIHRHPESAGEEERTAKLVADYLESLDIEVTSGVGGHGVVGILRGGKPGPVVAYRADMDAIRTEMPDPSPIKSTIPGVRHICGHDVHVAVALGIAEALASVREELPGAVKFIFQPAEEIGAGAKAMIEDGVMENPSPEAIYAVHCAPFQVGQFGSVEGFTLPGTEIVTIALSGEGDLETAAGAYAGVLSSLTNVAPPSSPEAAAELVSQEPMMRPDFMVGGVFLAEENPDGNGMKLLGMIKAPNEEIYAQARETARQGLAEVSIPGVSSEVSFLPGAIPATINDPELVQETRNVMHALIGKENLLEIRAITPFFSEDFAYYQQKIPGAMYFLGVSSESKGIVGMPHSPMFQADEGAVTVGARTMSGVILNYLESH